MCKNATEYHKKGQNASFSFSLRHTAYHKFEVLCLKRMTFVVKRNGYPIAHMVNLRQKEAFCVFLCYFCDGCGILLESASNLGYFVSNENAAECHMGRQPDILQTSLKKNSAHTVSLR